MKKSIGVLGMCLLLAAFAVAGCGDDDENSASGGSPDSAQSESADASNGSTDAEETSEVEPTSESKEEFVATANQVCKQRVKAIENKLSSLFEEGGAKGKSQQEIMSRYIDGAVAPGLEAEADELRELGAPEGDEEQIEEIAAAIDGVAADAREDPEAFLTQSAEFEDAHELASDYGIGACGTIPR